MLHSHRAPKLSAAKTFVLNENALPVAPNPKRLAGQLNAAHDLRAFKDWTKARIAVLQELPGKPRTRIVREHLNNTAMPALVQSLGHVLRSIIPHALWGLVQLAILLSVTRCSRWACQEAPE